MSDFDREDNFEDQQEEMTEGAGQQGASTAPEGKFTRLIKEGDNKYRLPGMYKNWFLDYASYVILDRAVPH